VRQHAALGGISLALTLGEAILAAEARGGHAVIDTICRTTGGSILAEGEIVAKDVVYTREAFDIGTVTIRKNGRVWTLHVMNEYMAVDDGDAKRIATFPDVITSLDPEGEPLSVGQLRVGQSIFVLHVPKSVIPLSSSVLDPSVYPFVEAAMGIDIASYALAKGA
jgi:DUF917 family protein